MKDRFLKLVYWMAGSRTWWVFVIGTTLSIILLCVDKIDGNVFSVIFLALCTIVTAANKIQAKIDSNKD